MDTASFLKHLRARQDYAGQIVHVERLPLRHAKYGKLDEPLEECLQDCLVRHDITALYSHQAEAINYARRGENVMVATSSASGKSLCYHLAVIQDLLTGPMNRALYLFPTKALAQDQLRSLREMFCPHLFRPEEFAAFDGDTPVGDRAAIRRHARIILTNPDMLHLGILPNHPSWTSLLRHLRYVVVDEAHVYRGVFGSHVSGVLRRLRRLSGRYGSIPQFICSSATVANPGEHAGKLTGLPFVVVDDDGAPHGSKDFVFWNPPLIDKLTNTRKSANSEATNLFTELVAAKVRTLTFTRTRRLTELIYRFSRDKLTEINPSLARRIKPYRAGYLPEERRKIERELFGGELIGAVATVALELGIDIGDLEATVLTGYPGSIASTWQQAGRSGRGRAPSLSFLIGLDGPLDQYLMHHPEFFFRKSFENALVNPDNPYILRAHLLCAAWEQPLTGGDAGYFGPQFTEEIRELEKRGFLRERRHRWYLPPSISYPAPAINIRATSGENYAIIDTASGTQLETVEASVAFFHLYPGAIYLHQGESYLITSLDIPGRTAYAAPASETYYTQTKELTDLRIIKTVRRKLSGPITVCLGDVEVSTTVIGFKKKAQFTDEVIGEEPLALPPVKFSTVALWFDLPPDAVVKLDKAQLDFAGGLHAIEHAAIGILPLFALCDRNDIGGVSTPLHVDTGKAQIFIYDGYPGGVGIAERGFEMIQDLWEATLKVIEECPCRDGCPSCVQSPKCGNNNKPLDKRAACLLLSGYRRG